MPEQLIPISKRQHDAVNQLTDAIHQNQSQLTMIANVILLGQDEEIPRAGIIGARCTDGVYSLVIEVPDIAPAVAAQEPAA